MFTGIVEEVGRIAAVREEGGNLRLALRAERVLEGMERGDSVAVGGACLTVVAHDEARFEVELSRETVAKTAPRWRVGESVTLERAVSASGRFGGHVVTGHIGGVGEVVDVRGEPGASVVIVRAPGAMSRYLIPKGSITVDGVSLTVVDVGGPAGSREDWPAERFSLWLIPHTLAVTTLGELEPGSQVNLEADVLAKYVERLTLLKAQERAAPELRGS
ncbi:riboflavin synthase [soil metagenome]